MRTNSQTQWDGKQSYMRKYTVPVKHNRMKTNTRIHARCPDQIQIHLGHSTVNIQINTYISNKQQRKQTLVVALKDHNKLGDWSDKCWCLGLDLSTSHPATSIRKTACTLPKGHDPLGALGSTTRTISPTCTFRWGKSHFCLSWRNGKYSRTHLFQKRSLKYCTCLQRRRT